MKINYAILPLVALMAITRVHHFGSAIALPDASLAVFFLAGLCFRNRAILVGLLLEAGVLDYVAINAFSVSDWCISPAYLFLIPTYGALWLAGRYSSRFANLDVAAFAYTLSLATLASSVAFLISNGSFYLFSGRYAEMAAYDYATAVAHYYGPYVSTALLYSAIGLVVIKARQVIVSQSQHREI